MPKTLLPEEIEKTLRELGEDGEKVRGTLERDFALYAKKAKRTRQRLRTVLTVAIARPLVLARVQARRSSTLFAPEAGDFSARLAEVRARAERGIDQLVDPDAEAGRRPPRRARDGAARRALTGRRGEHRSRARSRSPARDR